MGYGKSISIGRRGGKPKSFDILKFAENNGYRAYDLSWVLVSGNLGVSSPIIDRTISNTSSTGLWYDLDADIEAGGLIVVRLPSFNNFFARASNGEVRYGLGEQIDIDGSDSGQGTKKLTDWTTDNDACDNPLAVAGNLSFPGGSAFVYGDGGNLDVAWRPYMFWDKNVAGGALCSGSAEYNIRVLIKEAYFMNANASSNLLITRQV